MKNKNILIKLSTSKSLKLLQLFFLVAPIIFQNLDVIKDERDEESMKNVFDIVDDEVNDLAEKKLLLKQIKERTPPQVQLRKAEIRK